MKSFSTRGNQPPGARDEQGGERGRGGGGGSIICVFRLLSATISWRGAESGVNADERRVDIFSSFIYTKYFPLGAQGLKIFVIWTKLNVVKLHYIGREY